MRFGEVDKDFFKTCLILVIRESSSDAVPACRIKIESSPTGAGSYFTTIFTPSSSMAEQVLSDCVRPYRVVWFITYWQHANISTNPVSLQAVERELSAGEQSCSTNVPASIETYLLGFIFDHKRLKIFRKQKWAGQSTNWVDVVRAMQISSVTKPNVRFTCGASFGSPTMNDRDVAVDKFKDFSDTDLVLYHQVLQWFRHMKSAFRLQPPP